MFCWNKAALVNVHITQAAFMPHCKVEPFPQRRIMLEG